MVGAAGCVGSAGKGLVGGENVRGAGGGGYFVVGRAGPVAGAADAFKPNHKALQIGGKGSLDPQQQQLVMGRCPRRSGGFGGRSGRSRSPGSRRKRREKSHRNKAASLGQRRRRGPSNWDPRAAMPATTQGKIPRLRSVSAVLLLRQMGRRSRGKRGKSMDRNPAQPVIDRRECRPFLPFIACQDRRKVVSRWPPSRVQGGGFRGSKGDTG